MKFEGLPTESDIIQLIDMHKSSNLPRLQKLKGYYLGQHDILLRQYEDYKPQAKLVSNFPSYIVNQSSNYFMGTPVSYTGTDKRIMEMVDSIFRFNDEADTNSIHAENMAIYGVSYELLYINRESAIDTRFVAVSPEEMFCVYDYGLDPQITCAIRYYYDNDSVLHIEYYDDKVVNYYTCGDRAMHLVESIEHFFGDVPAIEYINNNNRLCDFEKVITLIDEYNLLQSDSANDFQYFSDAYLFLSGATIDTEAATNMKENKIINIDDPNASAAFLTKNIQDAALENYKNRLVNDIHKFSAVPNMTDEAFAGNLSGVAMKFKLLGLENLANMKERKFKKGLQRRLELIFNLMFTRGLIQNNSYTDISMTFSRTLPPNLIEQTQMVRDLQGIVSDETLLSMLSIVDDVSAELERIQKQKDQGDTFMNDAFDKALLEASAGE